MKTGPREHTKKPTTKANGSTASGKLLPAAQIRVRRHPQTTGKTFPNEDLGVSAGRLNGLNGIADRIAAGHRDGLRPGPQTQSRVVGQGKKGHDQALLELRVDLARAGDSLRAMARDRAIRDELLATANEEAQSSMDELYTINDELESTKDELHSR